MTTTSTHAIEWGHSHHGTVSAEASDDELHEVRCCSDVSLAGYVKRNSARDLSGTYACPWGESNIPVCDHASTWADATAQCQANGGRLCTADELRADCTRGSGCGHDRDQIWSSSTRYDWSSSTREVVVQDTTPPLIALIGSQSIEIHQYDKNSATVSTVTTVVVADASKDGMKCGTPAVGSNRVFDLRSSNANENACIAACENDENCVAFSGIMGSWCIGCSVDLDSAHGGAIAYKKTSSTSNIDTEDNGLDLGTLIDWTAASLNAKHLVHSVQVWDECSDINVATDVAITYLSADEQTPYTTSELMAEAPGAYIVRYTVTDGNGLTSFIDRSVTVVDNTAPIIRLAGASRIFVEFKTDSFSDPSATCKDYNNDSINVVTTGASDVDAATLGTYLITYSCTDGINAAHSQVLTVIVRDTIAPTFAMALGGGAMIPDGHVIQWGSTAYGSQPQNADDSETHEVAAALTPPGTTG